MILPYSLKHYFLLQLYYINITTICKLNKIIYSQKFSKIVKEIANKM